MLNDKDHAEKHLRAMHRELALLEKRRRHRPVHELTPPIQRGWKRSYVMTPAARLRPDAVLLAAILDCLNTVQYFWRSNFQSTRRQRSRRRGSASVEQEMMAIHWSAWERGPIPPGWRKYFRREFLPLKYLCEWPHQGQRRSPWFNRRDNQHNWGYAFRHPWWFELKVEKHWLTHYAEVEPEVARRIAEIERWMDFHSGHARFHRLKGRSDPWAHFERSPHRRCKRQIERGMRAHLGFLGDGAGGGPPHPKKTQRRGGGGGGLGLFGAASFPTERHQHFCGSEAGDTSPPTTDTRLGSLDRIPARRARVVGPDDARESRLRDGSCGAFLYGPSSPAASSRRRPTVRVQANGPGRLQPAFSAKTPRARSPRRPGEFWFVAVHVRGSEIGVTS